MRTIEAMLREELCQLKRIKEDATRALSKAPGGTLRIRSNNGKEEYYYRNATNSNPSEHTPNGRYMKKSEFQLVKRIAQRDYDEAVLRFTEERIKAIERFLKVYDRTSLKRLYQDTNPYRKALISAPVVSDEEFVKQWQAAEYKGKGFEDDENLIFTEKGERVRSKSEKIIADKLYALGIPYRYEYPLILDGNVKVYPDFTILKMPEREDVYLEHFGMMDHPEYVEKVLYKLNTYERNGIYPGVNLFITYETGAKPLNTRSLDGVIKKLFC